MSPASKHEMRLEMRARLRTLSGEECAFRSRRICAALAHHPLYAAARCVMVFDAMPSEPALAALWAHSEKRFVFPRVVRKELELVEIAHAGELGHAVFAGGYREPLAAAGRVVEPAEVELILVPGLAFTEDGHRLGRGGGFYDRLLARSGSQTAHVGVCFDVQIVERLPLEAHDYEMDAVVTDERVCPRKVFG